MGLATGRRSGAAVGYPVGMGGQSRGAGARGVAGVAGRGWWNPEAGTGTRTRTARSHAPQMRVIFFLEFKGISPPAFQLISKD